MRSVLTIHPSSAVVPLSRFELHDLDAVRLVLRGSSCVDWVRLNLSSDDEIDAFLRVNELNPDSADDRARLRSLLAKAVAYLEEHLRYRVPEIVRDTSDVRQLFRYASQVRGRRAYRFFACLVLKVMHIIHHAEAHELLSMLPISDAEVAVLVEAKIERVVRGLIERDFPIVRFSGNRKTPYSVYSKLLAKKSTQASQVLDKLRFRFVVERIEDIPPLILALTRELLPFCYLVPMQTHNSLVDLHGLLVRAGNVIEFKKPHLALFNEQPVTDLVVEQRNEFSGPDYRIINFVADVPLRMDRILSLGEPLYRRLGPIVLGGVECQIVDRMTAQKNEAGENRHTLYKARQRQRVKQRLEAGLRKERAPAQGDQQRSEG